MRAGQVRAVVVEAGLAGVLPGVVEDVLRVPGGAMGRVHVDTERRVLLHQGLGPLGELVGVAGHVLGVDRQQRLLTGERVDVLAAAGLVAGRRGFQPAGVGRDAAVGVAGFFGAGVGQAVAQLREVRGGLQAGGRDGGDAGRQQCDMQFHRVCSPEIRTWS
ncbi:hypothetical protein D9M70_527010 [compost metagenome]